MSHIEFKLILVVFLSAHLIIGFSLASYQGPSNEALINFWPFDKISGLETFPNLTLPNEDNRTRLLDTEPGPFRLYEASYTTVSNNTFLVKESERWNKKTFGPTITASFFFRRLPSNDESSGTLFILNGDLVSLSFEYAGNFAYVVLKSPLTRKPVKLAILNGIFPEKENWTFYTVIFDSYKIDVYSGFSLNLVANFDATKGISDIDGVPISPQYRNVSIGALEPGDALACFSIFDAMLLPKEMIRLPCVCRTRAKCPDDLEKYRSKRYLGPGNDAELAFFPLDKESGLNEMTRGLGPDEFRTSPFQTKFSQNLKNDTWMVEFRNFTKIPSSFSITFYLFWVNRGPEKTRLLDWNSGNAEISVEDGKIQLNGISFPENDHLKTGEWNFVALSLSNKRAKIYDQKTGKVISEIEVNLEPKREDFRLFKIGPSKTGLSLACLALFNRSLRENEISSLRCYCPTFSDEGRHPILGEKCEVLPPISEDVPFFIPLDRDSEFSDISRDHQASGILRPAEPFFGGEGPFGGLGNSFTVSARSELCEFNFPSARNYDQEFSVAFFFQKVDLSSKGQILAIMQGENTWEVFFQRETFWFSMNDHQLGTFENNLPTEKNETWTFIAFSLHLAEDQRALLEVYDEKGSKVVEHTRFPITIANENEPAGSFKVAVGELNPGDRIACLLFSNRKLTSKEVSKMPHLCKVKLISAWFDDVTSTSTVEPITEPNPSTITISTPKTSSGKTTSTLSTSESTTEATGSTNQGETTRENQNPSTSEKPLPVNGSPGGSALLTVSKAFPSFCLFYFAHFRN